MEPSLAGQSGLQGTRAGLEHRLGARRPRAPGGGHDGKHPLVVRIRGEENPGRFRPPLGRRTCVPQRLLDSAGDGGQPTRCESLLEQYRFGCGRRRARRLRVLARAGRRLGRVGVLDHTLPGFLAELSHLEQVPAGQALELPARGGGLFQGPVCEHGSARERRRGDPLFRLRRAVRRFLGAVEKQQPAQAAGCSFSRNAGLAL